jgi:ribosome-associated protein
MRVGTDMSEEELVSKTQIKNEMNERQALGMQLTKLAPDTLKKIGLSEELLEAVLFYKKITANGALKRQAQFIGRLMRDTDPEPIQAYLNKLKGDNAEHNAAMQRLELLRERLVESDDALTELISNKPELPISELRTLIRNARREKEQNKPPKAFRELFQLLKQHH